MDVKAGVGYGIVVDGFAGKFGTYEITISSSKVLHATHATLFPMSSEVACMPSFLT